MEENKRFTMQKLDREDHKIMDGLSKGGKCIASIAGGIIVVKEIIKKIDKDKAQQIATAMVNTIRKV